MAENMHTPALSDEELMSVAYGEGTLSASKQAHLEQCSICQQQLAMYGRTNTLLLTKLYRSICPSAVNLNYYCLGMVSEEERMRIASHVLDCPACADEVAEIRRTQASVELYPPGAWSPFARVRRIFAPLVMQQAQPVTRAGTPGEPKTGWPRQYRAETIDLSLHLSRASSGEMLLLGIITSNDPNEPVDAFEGETVELYVTPGGRAETGLYAASGEEAVEADLSRPSPLYQPQRTAEIDDVGNIVMEDIQPGNYVLILRLPDREVVIEELNIERI